MDAVVLHFHGGGFVCQNSFLHQLYTRGWAKAIDVPILSVDYRKSPEWSYPCALDDCFQTYMWLITFFDQVFDAKPSKLVVVGDSAGANLVLGVTALAIKFQVRVPDALLLSYPALKCSLDYYSPSKLLSLEDHMLSGSFLKACMSAYIPDGKFDPNKDPLLSPIDLPDSLLKAFPRIRMILGSADPLSDDGIRFTERLL